MKGPRPRILRHISVFPPPDESAGSLEKDLGRHEHPEPTTDARGKRELG